MPRFNLITTENPEEFREEIVSFWDAYLPETPHARLEWMNRGNPAGPATWLLAFEGNSKKLIGTISLMPRTVLINGKPLKAGILGDFMVHEKHRVFGLPFELPKRMIEQTLGHGIDFIYTIPNPKSEKIFEHLGQTNRKDLWTYARPIQSRSFLEHGLPGPLAKLLAPMADLGLSALGKMGGGVKGYRVEEKSSIDSSFDRLFQKMLADSSGYLVDRNSKYLTWRYLNNPTYSCRILVLRNKNTEELSGYIVFSLDRGRLEILDLVWLKPDVPGTMLKELIRLAGRERAKGIYFIAGMNSPTLKQVRRNGFWNLKEKATCFFFAAEARAVETWDFVKGDRNI